MEPPPEIVRLLYAVATAVSVGFSLWVWNYRERTGAKPLLVALAGAVVWCGAPLVGTLSADYGVSVFAQRALFIGVGTGVIGLFVFTLAYTGRERWIRPQVLGLLAIEPVLVVALAFVNPSGLFFERLAPAGSAWGIAVEWGPLFWVHATYSFLLLFIGSLFIFDFLVRAKAIYRGQAAALLFGTLFAWLGSLLHLVGPVSFNSTPIGITLGIVLFAVAIVRYRLIDLVPIARDRVFETINDVVLVVDRNERVIDTNQAARAINGQQESVAGEGLAEFFSATPEVVEYYRENTAERTEKTFEITVSGREYAGRLSPITDGRDRHVGWLIVGHDVTDRKRRERELRHRNKQLDRFAGIVSHDLRNPLDVASSRLELAREECDSEHLGHVADAHERIETIVEDTLTLARLGETVDGIESVDLGVVLRRWWDGVETGDATLEAPTDLVVRADPDRLRHVFENLFRNSVEHGSTNSRTRSDDAGGASSSEPSVADAPEGAVERGSRSPQSQAPGDDGGGLTVTVGQFGEDGLFIADDGHGLPDGIDIFESGETTSDAGTGLGLSIVEEVVTAHGWAISATRSDSGGARFEITGVEIE